MTATLKAGDAFPEGVKFVYVPLSGENQDIVACGIGIQYDASKEFKNKKVVLVSVPGAFTPTCQEQHVTGYIAKLKELKAKGVDQIIFIAFNDHWVMSAWGKANGIYDNSILFMNDIDTKFSRGLGWTEGPRTARYGIVVDHGKVVYAGRDVPKSVAASSAETILSKL